MSRTRVLGVVAGLLVSLGAVPTADAANPTSLLVPESTAFSILGHSCGGIREQAFTTGFDAVTGDPAGAVYLQTRCSTGGRGGHTVTYSAWTTDTWDFAGNVVSATAAAAPSGLDPSFSATDAYGDTVYNALTAVNVLPADCSVGNTTYCTYRAYLTVPSLAAPTAVSATRSAGVYQVAWTPDPAGTLAMTSSTVTATPVSSTTASVVTATATGTATTAVIGPLQPLTKYQITVVSTDAAGSSPPSAAVTVTTPKSTIVPSAPTGVTAVWTAPGLPGDLLLATWVAPSAGDSPINHYEVSASSSDAPTVTRTVLGSVLSTTLAVNDMPEWTVMVRAHNSAGWGPWSAPALLGGT